MERKNRQLELIRFGKNNAFRPTHLYFFEPMKSTRLACLLLDSRYNISMLDSNHFIRDMSRTTLARKVLTRCACSISARQWGPVTFG